MPKECNAFEFTDVALKIAYKARQGGETLRQGAWKHLETLRAKQPTVRLFSLKHEFPNEWYRFLNRRRARPSRCSSSNSTRSVPVRVPRQDHQHQPAACVPGR